MKRVRINRPFIGGMVTDQPAYALSAQQTPYAQDVVAPEGIARQRKGWAYNGTTADVASNLTGVYRNKFILADVTRTMTAAKNSNIYIHNASSAGTAVGSGTADVLPRCVYNDELIFCSQDGVTPIRRYSGVAFSTDTGTTVTTFTANKGTLTATAGTYAASVTAGSYVPIGAGSADYSPVMYGRVLERNSSTVLTVEGVKASQSYAAITARAYGTGSTFPCVNVYDAGTGSYDNAADEFNGTGTKWSTGDWGSVSTNDGLLAIRPAGSSSVHWISILTSDTNIDLGTTSKSDTNINYAILRSCPFTDAQAHKGSFWGTGVAQYPNNVYVGPPGWNLSFPPGFTLPFDPTILPESENVNDFLMDFIAVPSAYDGDVNVAILSSPNPLLVLKRQAVYGIFGSYPNFSADKIIDNAGCIDIRSAISGPNGQFWAGEEGVYAYIGGQIIDLTDQKINREWRSLTRDFDYGTSDYCAIGETYDHLFVSIMTGSGTSNRTYVYDLRNRAWISRFSNHKARYFFSSRVDGEAEKLYWVSDDEQGRVLESSVAVNGSGVAKDGDGTSPTFTAYTPQGIDGDNTIDSDSRMLDLAISTNLYDGVADATTMTTSVVTGGSLEAQADATKTLATIYSDTVDRVDRTRFREVNSKGRLHQVRMATGTTGTNVASTKIEVHEISATFRDRRDRT